MTNEPGSIEDETRPEKNGFQFQRDKLNNTLRERGYYPNAPAPGDCYVFDVALGIDPRLLPLDQVITKKHYKIYATNPDGVPYMTGNGVVIQVRREFTSQQRTALKEWWNLLSPGIRGI
jgi:hypothetical protein